MKKTDPARYPTEVFWSDEDEGYIALVPDLPGCSAWGATKADALREIEDAIASWMEAAESAGNPIPQPSRPRAPDQYSGKLLLRMTRQLHADLDRQAKDQGVSLNQHILQCLAAAARQEDLLTVVDARLCGTIRAGTAQVIFPNSDSNELVCLGSIVGSGVAGVHQYPAGPTFYESGGLMAPAALMANTAKSVRLRKRAT